MVQKEVADRLTAGPGSKVYGVPSVKLAWYAARAPGRQGAAERVLAGAQCGLRAGRVHPPRRRRRADGRPGQTVFAVIDAAFAQRRKMLRAALAGWAGGADAAADAARRGRGRPRPRAASSSPSSSSPRSPRRAARPPYPARAVG